MKKLYILCVAMLALSFGNTFAQSSANYTFTTSTTGSLALDANGNPVDMSTGTTLLVSASSDQSASAVTNIGFTFYLMGSPYTQFSASSNGILQLGSSAVSSSTYVASGGTVSSPKISAFGGDLQTGSSGKVHSKIVGTAPNRCLVIEFLNMNLYYVSGVFGNDATYQVRLYESTGKLEFVYGTIVVSSVSGAGVGDISPSIGFSTNTTANNLAAIDIATNTSTTTSPFTENPSSVVGPIANLTSAANGSRRVYTFTPPASSPVDPITLTFSSIGSSTMTANWVDNSTNESLFRVTRATDAGFTTNVVTSIVASTTTAATGGSYSSPQTGLSASTIYYFKIEAASEGTPPSPGLTGSQTTNPPANFTSAATGLWSAPATWVGGVVPSPTDNAIIDAGHVVSIDVTGLVINNLTVNATGTLDYGATPSSFQVNGNINNNGTINVFNATTGKTLDVKGNITNGGTFNASVGTTTAGNLTLSGSTVQTISGAGVFTNGLIRNLTITNTNTSVPNIIWNVNNVSIGYNLSISAAKIDLMGNKLTWGHSSQAVNSLTVTTGGFLPGGKFARYWTTSQTGSTITSATDPTTTTSRYPFINSLGENRSFWISRSSATATGNTAGEIAIVFTNGTGMTTGLSLVDGAYTVTDRFNGKWTITAESGYVYVSGTHTIAALAPEAYVPLTGNSRLMNATTFVGTHQAGTITPCAQRISLSTAQLTGGDFYLGINASENSATSIASGDFNSASTWSNGQVPTCTSNLVILSGHTVTVSTANVSKNVTIKTGGTLVIPENMSLTVGCTNNDATFSIDGGTFEMQTRGNLTVNGKFQLTANTAGVFKQSGGTIVVDGNSGTLATSTPVHIVDLYCHNTNTLQLTGGQFTVVDPPLSTTTTNCAFKVFPVSTTGFVSGSSPAWTLLLGDGVSNQAGGHSGGFLLNLANTNSFELNGSLIINTLNGTNRHVSTSNNIPLNNLSVTSGDYRISSAHFVRGDIDVSAGAFLTSTSTLTISDFAASAGVVNTVPQQITGTGTFRNLTASPTATLTSLTINSNSTLTLNAPQSISGTLLMTKGIINTSATNSLRLGTITAAGTLSTSSVFDNTTYINGPFSRTYGVTTSTNTFTNTHLWPVGKGGKYLPISISPTTTVAGTIFTAEASLTNAGSGGAGVSNLSTDTWVVTPAVPANTTNLHVQLGSSSIGATNQILQAPNASGAYSSIPTGTLYSAGTPSTLKTNPTGTPIPIANFTGYFAFGDLTPCITPTNQATSLVYTQVGSTSLNVSFTPTTMVDGYLVVRYINGATITPPVNGTSYTLNASLGVGTVVSIGSPTSFGQTGLTASTTYNYIVYTYNSIGCGGGPLYNNTSPLSATVTTCATIVNPITSLGTIDRTQTSITIQWTASTTVGATYQIDVASDAAFLNILQPNIAVAASPYTISGLTAGTTYNFRVRAYDPSTMCYSTNVSSSNGTLCLASNPPYSENLNGALNCLSILSTGTGNTWGLVAAPTTPTGMTGNTARIISSTTAATNNYFGTRALNLVGGTSYDLKFKYGNSSTIGTLNMEMLYNPAVSTTGGTSIATLSNIANTASINAYYTFTPPISGEYYILFRANGPIAGTTSTLYLDDIEVVETPPCSAALGGTATSSIGSNACGAVNTTTLASTGYSTGLGISYQWQKSTDNFVSDIQNLVGATNPLSASGQFTIGANYFRLKTECSNGALVGYSNITSVTNYSNPAILTTTPGSRCGTGTVSLQATASVGETISWFASSSGGPTLGTGNTFTTPSISSTTTFYASASAGGASENVGKSIYSATDNTSGTAWGLVFNVVTSAITINNVDVYSVGAGGSLTVELRDNAGTLITTAGPFAYPSGSTSSPVKVTLPVNFSVPVGTGYRMVMGSMSGNLIRESSGNTFPYNSPSTNVSITSGYISGTSTTYYWFYNWQVSTGCSGTRTPVVATVNVPPTISPTVSMATICNGNSTVLNVTSSNDPNYTYTWSPGPLTGAMQTVMPTVSTTYSVTASDMSGGANNGCVTTGMVSVTVNPSPSAISITPSSASLCVGEISTLTSSGGTLGNTVTIGTGTIVPGTTSYPNPLSAYYGGVKHQMIYTVAELTAQGVVAGTSINSLAFSVSAFTASECSKLTIRMKHTSNSTLTGFETGTTQLRDSVSFTPSSTGWATLTLNTPFIWNGTSNLLVEIVHNAGNAGNGSGTIVNCTTTASNQTYYGAKDNVTGGIVGFDALSSWSVSGGSTSKPNIRFFTSIATTISWSPTTNLYTDAGATIAYTGGQETTVYAKPSSNITYQVTATTAAGCTNTASVAITVSPLSVGGTVSSNQTICSGTSPMDLTLSGQTGSVVKWQKSADAAFTSPVDIVSTSTTLTGAVIGALTSDTYFRAVVQSGTCSSANSASVLITIGAPPAAPTGAATQSFCSSASPTVANLMATGTSIKWYDMASGGMELAPTTPLVNGNHYYASQTISGCESTARLDVTASIEGTVVTTSANTGAGSLRSVVACASEGTTITIDAGVTSITMTEALNLDKNLMIMDVAGAPVMITFDFTTITTYGIDIIAGKTVTLENLGLTAINNPSNLPLIQVDGTMNAKNVTTNQ